MEHLFGDNNKGNIVNSFLSHAAMSQPHGQENIRSMFLKGFGLQVDKHQSHRLG